MTILNRGTKDNSERKHLKFDNYAREPSENETSEQDKSEKYKL